VPVILLIALIAGCTPVARQPDQAQATPAMRRQQAGSVCAPTTWTECLARQRVDSLDPEVFGQHRFAPPALQKSQY